MQHAWYGTGWARMHCRSPGPKWLGTRRRTAALLWGQAPAAPPLRCYATMREERKGHRIKNTDILLRGICLLARRYLAHVEENAASYGHGDVLKALYLWLRWASSRARFCSERADATGVLNARLAASLSLSATIWILAVVEMMSSFNIKINHLAPIRRKNESTSARQKVVGLWKGYTPSQLTFGLFARPTTTRENILYLHRFWPLTLRNMTQLVSWLY